MKRFVSPIFLMAGALWLAGCNKPVADAPAAVAPNAASAPATAAAAPAPAKPKITYPGMPTEAQAKLPTIKLWIGPKEMTTEVARTELQRNTGEMYRTNVDENEGMIFVFDQPFRASFWMMNTVIPLSAAYIDADGVILEEHEFKALDTTPIIAGSDNVQYVLEAKEGWFDRNKIKVGTAIATENGPLKKVFFGQ